MMMTERASLVRQYAAVRPAGPAPIINTSGSTLMTDCLSEGVGWAGGRGPRPEGEQRLAAIGDERATGGAGDHGKLRQRVERGDDEGGKDRVAHRLGRGGDCGIAHGFIG